MKESLFIVSQQMIKDSKVFCLRCHILRIGGLDESRLQAKFDLKAFALRCHFDPLLIDIPNWIKL